MSATSDLLALLKRHYIKPGAPLPGGMFLPEVGWNPAGGASGRDGGCDAIYVGFTSTSGRILVGHELKVSRADWLNELNKPGKSDAWADQCHEWWLVVNDAAIVHDGELPAGWGLMVPGTSKTRMKIVAKPDRKPAAHTPSWLTVRSIMARQDTLRAQAISAARKQAEQEAEAGVTERVEQRIQAELARAADDGRLLDVSRDRLRALEKALGTTINWGDQGAYLHQATLADIEKIRDVLQETRTVKAAVQRMSGFARGHQLAHLQQALDTLRAALGDFSSSVSQ